MNRSAPPGNGKGALAGADPETADANDDGQPVNDPAVIGKQPEPQGDVFDLFKAVFGPSFGELLSAPPADSPETAKAEPTNGNGSQPELECLVGIRKPD